MSEDGVYQIVNAKSGTALDESQTESGAIIGWDKHQGENQKWYIKRQENGLYTVRNLRSGQFIGLAGQPNDNVHARSVNNRFDWRIERDAQYQNVYRFFVPDTQLSLDLTNYGDKKGGTPVAVWGKWPQDGKHQCWDLQRLS